ncbi:MAG: hypothetical protein LBQ15_03930 [Clostridium sp.]|jgi:hypothetical protein|nr:hypothetical protein [Clostridium sp.]
MKRHIILESLEIRKKESVILMIQGVLLFLLIIAIINISRENTGSLKQLSQTTTSLRQITDNFILEDERKFFSQPDNVLLLKEFYEWEKNNSMWKYIISNRQNVSLVDKEFHEIFEYGYEVRQRTEGVYKSIQVNDEFFKHFSLNVSEGREFLKEEYVYKDLLPVILGNEYKGIVSLNEKFGLGYLGIKFNCEVVGFLDKNSYFNNGYDLELLDYYIVLPSIEKFISTDVSEEAIKKFELKLYLDKCSGYIVSDKNSSFLQTQISKKCYELDMVPYSLIGMSNYYPTMWGIEGEQLGNILSYFAVLIAINSILCISLNMAAKITTLRRVYVIYIMNGMRRSEIIGAIIGEIFFVVFVSEILAAIISYCYWGQIPISELILLPFIISFLSSIYPWQMLRKVDLSFMIKEQENI